MIVPYVQAAFGPEHLKPYLQALYGAPLRVLEVRPMPDGPLSARRRLRVDLELDGRHRRVILETLRPGPAGLDHMPDRALRILRAHAADGVVPRHARSLDIGVLRGGSLQSLGRVDEFFQVVEDAPGRPYAEDVDRLAGLAVPADPDLARADALCAWMAALHARPAPGPELYAHRLRDRIAEGFQAAEGKLDPDRLRALEHRCVDGRWRLRDRIHRLRAVHGDLDPANLVFVAGNEFAALGGTGPWGDPAEDVLALTLAYAVAAWKARGRLDGALATLHDRVWRAYLRITDDRELTDVAPPWLAARALERVAVEGSALIRERLLRLAERCLEAGRYDPDRLELWSLP